MTRGVYPIRRPVRVASACFGLSLALHGGIGVAVGTFPMVDLSGTSRSSTWAGSRDSDAWSQGALAYLEPDQASKPQSPDDPALAALLQELAAQVQPPPPLATPEPEVRLGLAESPHITDNWIGFVQTTPHSAMLATTDQPELALKAGTPGDPMASDGGGGESGADGDGAIDPQPSPAAALPTLLRSPPSPQVTSQDSASQPQLESKSGEELITREGVDRATDDFTVEAAVGTPEGIQSALHGWFVGPPLPDRLTIEGARIDPAPLGHERGTAVPIPATTDPTTAKSLLKSVEPTRPMDNLATRDATAGRPGAPGSPGALGAPGQRGDGASTPGMQSERESDASSRIPTLDIRPGMPAAGEGLEVLTRRFEPSLFNRAVGGYLNPLLRVTFDRSGKVSHIEIVESSRNKNVDDATVVGVYNWTARGKRLSELPPGDQNAGVTFDLRIYLRG